MKIKRSTQRVLITGLGVISALGKNHSEFWQALSLGKTGIEPITQVDCSQLNFKQGAEVKNFNCNDYFEAKRITFLDRFAQFALIAAREAVADAGLIKKDLRYYTNQ